jgi:hypothetical protein
MTTKTKIIIGAAVAAAGIAAYFKFGRKKLVRTSDGSVRVVSVECDPDDPGACEGGPAVPSWLTSDAPAEYLTRPLYSYFE